MDAVPQTPPGPKSHLDEISTRWPLVQDPLQFVMRYAPAIRGYLGALIADPHDAEDVCQDFLLNVLARGFAHASPDRGRFRKYLKTAVRNAALMHFRRGQAERQRQTRAAELVAPDEAAAAAESEWLAGWRACVLERAWNALHARQRRCAGDLYYTALRTAVDHPDADSAAQAEYASALLGKPIRPDAFRKQLSRARHLFAELLVQEVAQTLQHRTPDAVEEELVETGLMAYVRDFLPEDWRTWEVLRQSP